MEKIDNYSQIRENMESISRVWIGVSFILFCVIGNADLAAIYVFFYVVLHIKLSIYSLNVLKLCKALWFIATFSFTLNQCAGITIDYTHDAKADVKQWLEERWRFETDIAGYKHLIGSGRWLSQGNPEYSLFYKNSTDLFLEMELKIFNVTNQILECNKLKIDPKSTLEVSMRYSDEHFQVPAEKYCIYDQEGPRLMRMRISDADSVNKILNRMMIGRMPLIDKLQTHSVGLYEALETLQYPHLADRQPNYAQ